MTWIVVRAHRQWFAIVFLSVWLVGWTLGGLAAISSALGEDGGAGAFLFVWLIFWAVGWVLVVMILAWQLGGKAEIAIDGPALLSRWSMPLLSQQKRYELAHVRNPRGFPAPSGAFGNNPFVLHSLPPILAVMSGGLGFDYGGRSLIVLHGLDDTESNIVAGWISEHLPEG
ncbi:MAG: hypothetical protein AAF697_10625 [Pseudomonadota bacterium]